MRTLAAADLARLRENLRATTDPRFAAGMLENAEAAVRREALQEFLSSRPLLRELVEGEG